MRRRSLLKAIAAGSLTAATPLATLLARNAMAQDGPAPIRTIFLFHPNGCVPDLFFPAAGSSALPDMTRPLQSVYENLVFLDGIGYAGSAGTHEGGTAKCLTGKLTRGDKLPSIEVLMGKEDRDNNRVVVPSVQMGVAMAWGDGEDKRVSFGLDGNTLDAEGDPRVLYPRLFGVTGGDSSAGGSTTPYAKMLSVAKDDLKRLETALGGAEKSRMEQHAYALSVLESRLVAADSGGAMGAACGPGAAYASEADTKLAGIMGREAFGQHSVIGDVSDLQQRLAAAALSCNLTRSIAFSYSVSVSPVVVPNTSVNDHELSHQSGQQHVSSKIWWMAEVAKFIKLLADTPEGNGSLLDNTIIVGVSDLGNGTFHDHYRIPMFLASGPTATNNTKLVTGRSLDFRPYGTAKVLGDRAASEDAKVINHTDVLDTVRQVAGYSFEMPNKEGDIMAAWTGGDAPR